MTRGAEPTERSGATADTMADRAGEPVDRVNVPAQDAPAGAREDERTQR